MLAPPAQPDTPEMAAHRAKQVAARARFRRVELGLTREELARRSGIAPATIKLFERTGRISLARLGSIAALLGRVDDVDMLFIRRVRPDSPNVHLRRALRRQRGGPTRRGLA